MTRYIAFDLETTGVSSFRDLPVSYGFVEMRTTPTGVEYVRDGGLINPGVPIPRGASAIHGITDSMVADAMPLNEAVELLTSRLLDVWSDGGVITGMNVSYDLTMVHAMATRVNTPRWSLDSVGGVLDVLVLDRRFDKWRKGARKLTDLCSQYGVSLVDAHAAVDDAQASLEVLLAQIAKFPEISEIDAASMNGVLGDWHRDWLSSFSSYLEKKGEPPISRGRYDWPIATAE